MDNNDEFKMMNDECDDAQAVQQSELLPIYDVMNYSGDIQPLEDVTTPEMIVTDYNHLNSNNKSFDRSRDIKRKRRPLFKGINISLNQVLKGVIIAAVVAGVITGVYFLVSNINKNDSPIETVYEAENSTVIRLKNGKTYNVSRSQNVQVSKNGMLMYYSRNTESKTGQYDIRIINVNRKNSLEKEGFYIDNGINEEWNINNDGSYLCYSKTNAGITEYYMYSAETGKSELITNELEELYMPNYGDVIYFTRRNGNTYSLHRHRYGENSQNVASGIDYSHFYRDEDNFEILYTVKTGNEENVDVYSVTDYDEPKKVCADVSEVYPDDYQVGGNLYYFKKNASNVDWQDFIDDRYYESDVSLNKPVEGDFMVEKGYIFKRYVLDTYAYNSALQTYKSKLLRDKIRDELNKIDFGLSVKNEYTCYAYDGNMSRKLASGVVLDNIISYATTGAPRIVFGKSVIDVDNKISMSSLVNMTSSQSLTSAIDYVREVIGNSYSLSNDCIYSWFDGNKTLSYTVNDYDMSKTRLILGSRSTLFAVTDGELYSNTVSTSEIEPKKLIDDNVTDFTYDNDVLYYNKAGADDNKTLYRYTSDIGKQVICNNAYSYFTINNNYIIVLSRQDTDAELMSIGLLKKGKYTIIDTDANLNHFVHNTTGFAYIKNVNNTDNTIVGEIYTYTVDKGVDKCGENATRIFYTND